MPEGRMPGRKEQRFNTELKVRLEGDVEGTARNVSATGIFFVTRAALRAGQPVKFKLEFQNFPSGPIQVECSARIVRVEEQGAGWGVGASIESFEFHTLPRAGKSSH
jgi:hypothetical protein